MTPTEVVDLDVDLDYVPRGRIRVTYLLGAVTEAGRILAWNRSREGLVLERRRRRP